MLKSQLSINKGNENLSDYPSIQEVSSVTFYPFPTYSLFLTHGLPLFPDSRVPFYPTHTFPFPNSRRPFSKTHSFPFSRLTPCFADSDLVCLTHAFHVSRVTPQPSVAYDHMVQAATEVVIKDLRWPEDAPQSWVIEDGLRIWPRS